MIAADLAVALEGPARAPWNDKTRYKVTVRNLGPVTARKVRMSLSHGHPGDFKISS